MRLAKPPSVTVNTYRSSSGMSASITEHAEQRIARPEPRPAAGGWHGPHRTQRLVTGGEPDRLALARDQQHVVGPRAQLGADQFVVGVAEATAITPACRGRSYAVSGVFFTSPRLVASR